MTWHFFTCEGGDLRLRTLLSRMGYALRATIPFWPHSCKPNVREGRCGSTFGTLDAQATAQLSCEETSPEQLVRKPSLYVANVAINLRPLVSPIQEGEMHELFIKRKSSQA
jgi:hypothetical protein